jgi:hypothetical protein
MKRDNKRAKKTVAGSIDQKMISFVLKQGIKIYPVQNSVTQGWFIQINNNGKITTSKNGIGHGSILKPQQLIGPLKKAYQYYFDLIKKQENEVKN